MSAQVLVLDASVGVKWFLDEPGSAEAMELLESSAQGLARIAVPAHFMHEVLSVVARRFGPDWVVRAWEQLAEAGVEVIPLTDEVVAEAAVQCAALGCSFYDALAPACASLLGATLVSADARAHGAYPNVRLVS